MDTINWLLLITSVAGDNGSLRVRLWRQLKAAGAAALRDGAYLLPAKPESMQLVAGLRDELLLAGGTAFVVEVPPQNPALEADWRVLFDRTDVYRQWTEALKSLLANLPEGESDGRRALRQRRKDLEGIAAIDFFGGEAQEQARQHFTEAERQLTRHYSPDEPLAASGDIPALSRADYQGRVWATRARPWVDRVASAWLIRRFIDANPRFLWLTDIAKCPSDALGFDFDGATFTHVGERVTFEVLMTSFGLLDDAGLLRLGDLVHALDVGGEPTPEGAGFEAILAGARSRITDDDALLTEASATLDSLYAYFSAGAAKPGDAKSIKKTSPKRTRSQKPS